jgi:hypothetical protein
MGGPSVATTEPRRAIYTKVMRNTHDPLIDAFDAPDGSNTTPTRNVTITPTQSLMLINGAWTLDRARAFAGRLERLEGSDPSRRIALAYRLAFGRAPAESEVAEAGAFLDRQSRKAAPQSPPPATVADAEGGGSGCGDHTEEIPSPAIDPSAWIDFCHALLNANEFLYVD